MRGGGCVALPSGSLKGMWRAQGVLKLGCCHPLRRLCGTENLDFGKGEDVDLLCSHEMFQLL